MPRRRARLGGDLFSLWLVTGAACTALMVLRPGEETIPYHLAWASYVLMYGFGNWGLRRAVTGLSVVTVVTGAVLVGRAATGVLAWEETTEIPLMAVLMMLAVWNVRRRQIALAASAVLAERQRDQAADAERLTRLTSHEMRTPLTIASGYVELLLARTDDDEQRRDLDVVADELGRLARVTERLVRVIRLQGGGELEKVDLDGLLRQTTDRWSQVADRRWAVATDAGLFDCSAERLRAVLDTLIENAVRYTSHGDVIRITGHRQAGMIELGVADSGSGLSAEQIASINGTTDAPLDALRDGLSQTGLGLSLVRGLVAQRGGQLVAGTALEGGASLVLRLPVSRATAPDSAELGGPNPQLPQLSLS